VACCGIKGAEPEGEACSYGHEIWVVTERTRLWIQSTEMGFLWRMTGLSLRDRSSSAIRRELGVKQQLFSIEKSQLRCEGVGVGVYNATRSPLCGGFRGISSREEALWQTQKNAIRII